MSLAHAWQVQHGLQGMPEYLATHFAGGGQPNGWMSHQVFRWFAFGLWATMVLSFWGIAAALPSFGPRWINIPHREHWLAPGRAAESIATLRNYMEFFGVVTLLGIIGMNEMLFASNRMAEPRLNEPVFFAGLVAYLVGTAVWIWALWRKFPKPTGR